MQLTTGYVVVVVSLLLLLRMQSAHLSSIRGADEFLQSVQTNGIPKIHGVTHAASLPDCPRCDAEYVRLALEGGDTWRAVVDALTVQAVMGLRAGQGLVPVVTTFPSQVKPKEIAEDQRGSQLISVSAVLANIEYISALQFENNLLEWKEDNGFLSAGSRADAEKALVVIEFHETRSLFDGKVDRYAARVDPRPPKCEELGSAWLIILSAKRENAL